MHRKLGISSGYGSRRFTGVGVLIVTNYMGKPHFVLGREAYKSIKVNNNYCVSVYEEFGGGIQKPSFGLEVNACYELNEETSNLFDISDPEILKKGINKYFDIPFKEDRLYRLYVIYIENAEKLIQVFNFNRQILLDQANTYYKYNHFLEMDKLELIPLDAIKTAINDKINYICLYPEDNAYNDNTDTKSYIGMLRVVNDIFVSKRLAHFLNTMYDDKTGLDWCYSVFYDGYINSKYMPDNILSQKITRLSEPRYNSAGTNKLKFLDGTYSFDVV